MIDVTQDLVVTEVSREGSEVAAALDGLLHRRHVRWAFADDDTAARHERTLLRWQRERSLVTCVERPGAVAVLDERALLARALEGIEDPADL